MYLSVAHIFQRHNASKTRCLIGHRGTTRVVGVRKVESYKLVSSEPRVSVVLSPTDKVEMEALVEGNGGRGKTDIYRLQVPRTSLGRRSCDQLSRTRKLLPASTSRAKLKLQCGAGDALHGLALPPLSQRCFQSSNYRRLVGPVIQSRVLSGRLDDVRGW